MDWKITAQMSHQPPRNMNRALTFRKLVRLIALAIIVCFIASIRHSAAAAQTANDTLAVSLSATAAPTFTISGAVTDTTGHGLAGVTMVLLSDVTGTQITFTDQSGNYVFTYAGSVSHTVRITPSKSGYAFEPLWTAFVSSVGLTGNQTTSFVGTQSSTPSSGQVPILLTQENSLSALALDSVTMVSEPFRVTGTNNFSTDQRTRVSLFAANVELGAAETSSVITAQAEDSAGQIFPLTIEYFGAVPNFGWLKQVVVKLPDQIANSVEVRVSLKLRSTAGNKVTVKVNP